MSTEEQYATWRAEAAVLAEIGEELFGQTTRVTVRLPRRLAERAVTAWHRDDEDDPVGVESHEQVCARLGAGALALIGLTVHERGRPEGEHVVVELEAWYIGSALDAADAAGLLGGHP